MQDPVITKINTGHLIFENYLSITNAPSWNMYKLGMGDQNGVIVYSTYICPSINCTTNLAAGTMTATIGGKYLVFFCGFADNNSQGNNTLNLGIRVNGTEKARAYCDKTTYTTSYFGDLDMTVILDLAVGDVVDAYVDPSRCYFHGNDNCSFGGFLIG